MCVCVCVCVYITGEGAGVRVGAENSVAFQVRCRGCLRQMYGHCGKVTPVLKVSVI